MDEPIEFVLNSQNGRGFRMNQDAINILNKETRFVISRAKIFKVTGVIRNHKVSLGD